MTEMTMPPLADTSDMANLHQVFRDALDSAVPLIGSCDPDDGDHVEMVASYYDNVLRLLHAHHESEDVVMTPRLLERCTPEEAAEVQRVANQHESVLGGLETAERKLAAWRSAPSLDSATVASTALVYLNTDLSAHLDDEERTVVPLAARYIYAPEWGEMPSHGMQHFTGDKLWLVLGLIREQMTPAQIADMDAHMPPPVADFWTGQGEAMFTEYVGKLRA